MKVISFGVVTTFSLLMLLAISGHGQGVQGRVYLPNGRPIDRSVRVDLRGPRFSPQTVDTDSSGRFSFRAVGPGNYFITVEAGEEFEPATESILIDEDLMRAVRTTSFGKSTQISIYLKLKRGSIVPAATTDARMAAIPPKAVARYESGLALFSAGKLEEAISEFRKAVESFPAFHQAYLELGKIYLKLSRFDDSVTALQSALTYEPNNYEIRLHLGMALLNQKKFSPAEEQLVAAADLDKHAVTPEYYRGVIKYETNDFDGALAAFEKAAQLNGDKPFPNLHKYLAGVYIKKNKWALAAAELETYLSQAPDAKDREKIRETIAELRSKPN